MKSDVYTGNVINELSESVDRANSVLPTNPTPARSTEGVESQENLEVFNQALRRLSPDAQDCLVHIFIGAISSHVPAEQWKRAVAIAEMCQRQIGGQPWQS